MNELTQKSLIFTLVTVVPLYMIFCGVVGKKKGELVKWLSYGVAGSLVLLLPVMGVMKSILRPSYRDQGVVAGASEWNHEWISVPNGASEIVYFKDLTSGYFSAKVDRDAFVSWCQSVGMKEAARKEWPTIQTKFLTPFQNRGVDVKGKKLYYKSGDAEAVFYKAEEMMIYEHPST